MAAFDQDDLEAAIYSPFNAVRFDFPGYTARFWSGVGTITMLGESWVGAGEIGSIGTVDGALDPVSPQLRVGLTGLDETLTDELQDYVVRGSHMAAYFNLLDISAGTPVADPDTIFMGRVDQAPLKFADEGGTVSIEVLCIGALEWAMRQTVGRWIPSQQEDVWSGDLYCEFTDDGYLDFPFGNENGIDPRTGARRASYSGSGGGPRSPLVGGGSRPRLR